MRATKSLSSEIWQIAEEHGEGHDKGGGEGNTNHKIQKSKDKCTNHVATQILRFYTCAFIQWFIWPQKVLLYFKFNYGLYPMKVSLRNFHPKFENMAASARDEPKITLRHSTATTASPPQRQAHYDHAWKSRSSPISSPIPVLTSIEVWASSSTSGRSTGESRGVRGQVKVSSNSSDNWFDRVWLESRII